jgi:hypothetical protein
MGRNRAEYQTVEVEEVIRDGGAAVWLKIGGRKIWVPKSQIESPDELEAGDTDVEVNITAWLCEKEDIGG